MSARTQAGGQASKQVGDHGADSLWRLLLATNAALLHMVAGRSTCLGTSPGTPPGSAPATKRARQRMPLPHISGSEPSELKMRML
jgi:hypothetical protein